MIKIGTILKHENKTNEQLIDELLEMRQRVAESETSETQFKLMEESLRKKADLLTAINDAMTTFLGGENWKGASAILLRCALSQTESEYGFVGVVVEGPVLRILAHEGIVWDKVINRAFYKEAMHTYHEHGYLEFTNFENLFGRVITSGKVVVSNVPRADPRSGGLPRGHPPLLSFLGVPILMGNKVVGMIGVANRPGGYSGTEQSDIETLVRQAGVLYDGYRQREQKAVMEKEHKRKEKDSSKKNKELEILNTITQAVHESLDLEEVYKIALDMTTALENVDMAMIYLVDDDNKEAVLQVSRNVPEDYIHRAGRIPYPKGVTWKVINTGGIINIKDIQKDSNVGPAGRDVGHHSALGIPITLEEQVKGVLWFLSYKERQFNKQEIKLLSSIGVQLAIAIAKANLYRQLSKKNRYESTISAVTRSVHQSINLQEVLENAVEAMTKNIDVVGPVAIYLVEGKEAIIRAHRGHPDWFVKRLRRIPYPKGYTWKTIIEGKPMYCPDVDKDTVIGPAGRELGTKSYASMPIQFQGKTVGCINVTSFRKRAFDEDEINLLWIVAQQIETAINNARQTEALRNSEDALQKTNEELELRVKERTQKLSEINKELKKEIVKRRSAEEHTKKSLKVKEILLKEIQHRVRNNLQIITGLLYLQSGQFKDKKIINVFNETQNRIRSMALIHEQLYQSKNLRSINFGDYVRNIGTYLLNSHGIKLKGTRLKIKIRNASMNTDKAILCGLIVNELISNALKHAFPNNKEGEICIDFHSLNSNCVLTVSDNGIGFPKDLNYRQAKSLGLQLVTALTDQLDGSIKINRRSGTSFKITFPEK